ncbi:MAG: serine/threonine-protein kinase [Kofleriaceae bacterium]
MVSPGDIFGAHRIVSLLGAGGMGNVWIAEHSVLQRRVAIKVLRPELSECDDLVERFFDEARAAARISDPGIVAVHDFGRHEGSAYIVMELLAGETLATRLVHIGRLPSVVASRLAMHVAMTMAVAHGHGIVHRDLKPDNLFLVPDAAVAGGERLKILDFGIAKLLAEHDAASRTQTGAILGTPMYMSPEQCRNAGGVDHRTDIYALGCVLFHMLCGRPPFAGTSSGDLIAAHLVDEPPSASSCNSSVSTELDAIVARCLRKPADERFATMSELARALAPCANLAIDIATIAPLRTETRWPSTALPGAITPSASRDVGLLTTLATGAGEARVRLPHAPRRSILAISVVAMIMAIVGIAAIQRSSRGSESATPRPATPTSSAGATKSTSAETTKPTTPPPSTASSATSPPAPLTTAPAPSTAPAPPIAPTHVAPSPASTPRTKTKRPPRRSGSTRPASPVPTESGSERDHGAYELDD